MKLALGTPAVVLGALLGLVACESDTTARAKETAPSAAAPAKTQARISQELTATAEVVTVDRDLRRVTLRGEEGRLVDVHCGPAVRNFDQIAVGDRLRVRYEQSLAASLRPPDEKPGPVGGAVAAARAKKGETPAAGAGITLSVRVKIESIDVPRDVVVFSFGTGELVAHRIATAEGRSFVRGLKLGDVVQLDYAETVALAIEKLPKGE